VAGAEYKCMKIIYGPPNPALLVDVTLEFERTLLIDRVSNLHDDRVYIFSGKEDSVVNPIVVQTLESYYKYFTQPHNIVGDYALSAEHCFPTLNYGEECTTLSSPYIGKCGFDGAKAAFKTLFESLAPAGVALSKNLFKFSQVPYWPDSFSSLADVGYLYVPTDCQSASIVCHLHISLHGCEQTQDLIGNEYVTKIGMNEWAETNRVIVLYPYAARSDAAPVNPNG
jgi:hypothetical protein